MNILAASTLQRALDNLKCNIKSIKKIGDGAYGCIYSCKKGKNSMVLKLLTIENNDGIQNLNEIDIVNKFSHPNLISCSDIIIIPKIGRLKIQLMALVIPLAISDLSVYKSEHEITDNIKIKLILDCAKGLHF